MMDMEKKMDALIREFTEFRSGYQRDQLKDAEMMGKINHELSELNSAVRGNERNDQPGLIGRMRTQEKKHEELTGEVRQVKKQHYKIQVWAMGLATVINVLWIALKETLLQR